ncbi:DUF1643 domain-containing protein [Methylobacterium gnaphalii]|uniref:DUF1643 domain-containing protein n=1 Tax=Methylobacterium gnaphalii TaxID=1010610 RepID=A0A512JIX9_9HYPH|nr:DUF1643 domain-containing protein [Methylobacterium gnaphalii]GEP09883.1 hypothetical protein MGN01_17280 [Methylobacterium gnaphalii]GJD68340.1 hypothetical protein MMMDOFMJ_1263 [Methylobacterium gnaphalii]GLS49912.1 hypothetical protein GCM10007885_27640 [Methylobacterium gnaphalii]
MSAIISPCGAYRYRLERSIGGLLAGPTFAWIMVNPSTADAEANDHTIRKVIGFSERLGAGHIVVGNLFAYRATDIRALRTAADPIGVDGGDHLRAIMREAKKVIVAWGPCAKLPRWLRNRWMEVAGIAEANGIPLWCLGTAQDGHPLHPLTLGYERSLSIWKRPDLEALAERGVRPTEAMGAAA